MTSHGLTKVVLDSVAESFPPKGSSSVIDGNASPDHSICYIKLLGNRIIENKHNALDKIILDD